MLADDKRPKKKLKKLEGIRRFIEEEAEEDSEGDDIDEYEDDGFDGELKQQHESQYYRDEEL